MRKQVRQASIVEMIERAGYLAVGDAAAALSVTMQTIRRDFEELIRIGAITRHHGGATPNVTGKVASYTARRSYLGEAKRAIGCHLAGLISPGATVFIESGTTLEAMGPFLSHSRPARVVTNNLNLALLLARQAVCPVQILPGQVRQGDGAAVGEATLRSLDDYRFDLAIIGAAAVGPDGAILDHDIADVAIARRAIALATRSVLAVDATKFRHQAPLVVAPIAAVSIIVTDQPPPSALQQAFEAAATAIHLAAAPGLSRPRRDAPSSVEGRRKQR